MTKRSDDRIRRKAIRAITAVTAGAMLFAGVACTSDDDDSGNSNNGEWNLQDGDASGDTAEGDVTANHTQFGDTDGQSESKCNMQESTGECHEDCTIYNDKDCCNEDDFGYWSNGDCAVAIEGPFIPPRMPA